MRGIDGDWRQQRINLALIELRGMLQLLGSHVLLVQHTDARCVQRGPQRLVPASILALDEGA